MDNPLVIVRSLVYNHEPYLRQCLDGFVMQKTNFKFEVQIHDDASTDNSAAIILEYAEKYPDIIKPYIEEENQYSKGRKGKWKWGPLNCKYIAICEGDDYWIDPLKLQKQVDYLEGHPRCTMVCNRTKIYSERLKVFVGEKYWYNKNRELKTKEIIRRGGGAIQTASVIYRKDIINNYPDYCLRCATGDHPLQLTAAMKGYIYYMNDIMSVYRIDNSLSWIGSQKRKEANVLRLKTLHTITDMLSGFAKDYPKYKKSFEDRRAMYILNEIPNRFDNYEAMVETIHYFEKEIKEFSIWWKIDLFLRTTRIPILNRYYYKSKYIYNGYRAKFLKYK